MRLKLYWVDMLSCKCELWEISEREEKCKWQMGRSWYSKKKKEATKMIHTINLSIYFHALVSFVKLVIDFVSNATIIIEDSSNNTSTLCNEPNQIKSHSRSRSPYPSIRLGYIIFTSMHVGLQPATHFFWLALLAMDLSLNEYIRC